MRWGRGGRALERVRLGDKCTRGGWDSGGEAAHLGPFLEHTPRGLVHQADDVVVVKVLLQLGLRLMLKLLVSKQELQEDPGNLNLLTHQVERLLE